MSTQLQNLNSEFNSLLTQYKDTYQNYINALNTNNINLTTVPNTSFIGTSNINTLSNSTITSCKTACSTNTSCTGATFNSDLNTCILSNGTGSLISTNQSIAIVQEAIYYSYQLQQLNSKLININNQMMNNATQNESQYNQNQQQNTIQNESLNNNYYTLQQEKNQINEMIRQYETLNAAYNNGSIEVNSNYFNYVVLLLIVILLIFILIKLFIKRQR
jgi:hypothetical protein